MKKRKKKTTSDLYCCSDDISAIEVTCGEPINAPRQETIELVAAGMDHRIHSGIHLEPFHVRLADNPAVKIKVFPNPFPLPTSKA